MDLALLSAISLHKNQNIFFKDFRFNLDAKECKSVTSINRILTESSIQNLLLLLCQHIFAIKYYSLSFDMPCLFNPTFA